MTILDFAAQTQYHNAHSVFTIRSEDMTNFHNVHFWMKMVHSTCGEPGDKMIKPHYFQ